MAVHCQEGGGGSAGVQSRGVCCAETSYLSVCSAPRRRGRAAGQGGTTGRRSRGRRICAAQQGMGQASIGECNWWAGVLVELGVVMSAPGCATFARSFMPLMRCVLHARAAVLCIGAAGAHVQACPNLAPLVAACRMSCMYMCMYVHYLNMPQQCLAPHCSMLHIALLCTCEECRGVLHTPQPCLAPRCSVLHVNGIAVYVEEQDADGEGGAIMVGGFVSCGFLCTLGAMFSL